MCVSTSKSTDAKDPWALPAPCKLQDEDARNLIVSYLAGNCSPAGKRDLETHFRFCEQCQYTLVIIQELTHSTIGDEKVKALGPLGMQAARITRLRVKRKPRHPWLMVGRVAAPGRLIIMIEWRDSSSAAELPQYAAAR